ncbi:MAG: M48 family metalloprotease [Pseudomonadota bacterium]
MDRGNSVQTGKMLHRKAQQSSCAAGAQIRNRGWRALLLAVLLVVAFDSASDPSDDLPDFGDSAGAIISPAQEKKLGESFMRQVRRYAPVVDDEEVEDYIQQLGESLAKHAEYDGEFTFFMIESNVINAFAVPGGFIGFHTGLILNSKGESEVASVMAHEIVHITQRHGARGIEAQARSNIPAMAALLGALVLAAVDPQAGIGALTAVQAAQVQKRINFTRSNEREADRIGIKLLNEAGYDTRSMADFFERLQIANRYTDPKHIPEILRTHPVTTNRISEAKERAESMDNSNVRDDSFEYKIVWHKLNVAAANDPNQAKEYYEDLLESGDYDFEPIARYGYVLALTEAGDVSSARVEAAKLLASDPGVISFRLAAARVEQRANDFQAALAHFRAAYEMDPTSRAATYGYANMLTLAGEPEKSRKLLRSFGVGNRQDPKFYKLIAEAETRMGALAKSHFSLAEYYRIVGELNLSAVQLRLAQKAPDVTNYELHRIDARLDEVNDEMIKLRKSLKQREKEREQRRR